MTTAVPVKLKVPVKMVGILPGKVSAGNYQRDYQELPVQVIVVIKVRDTSGLGCCCWI